MLVAGRLVIPPALGVVNIPANEVDSATALTEEFDQPLVKYTPLVYISLSSRIGIGPTFEVTPAHGVDELGRSLLVTQTELALGKGKISLCETDRKSVV